MVDAGSDVGLAAEQAKRKRRDGILRRRALFYAGVAWYFVFRISQPVHLECAHVENARVNCFMLRKWAGFIPGERRDYADVRRARVEEELAWTGFIRTPNYYFNLDTGALLRSDRGAVKWMNAQNPAELEKTTDELNTWLRAASSTNYRHDFRQSFFNGMLLLLLGIGVLALVERWIKRQNARRPLQIA